MTNPAIEAEFQKHEAWKEKTQLRATPTIVVNGYKLPDNYKIEDLRYFTDFADVIAMSEATKQSIWVLMLNNSCRVAGGAIARLKKCNNKEFINNFV